MPAFQEELVVKLRGPGGVAASGAPQVERFSEDECGRTRKWLRALDMDGKAVSWFLIG
jgi:hypothetical protein